MLFTINYRDDVTTACFVEYKGVKYNVNRIDTFEGYKQDITLYCKEKVKRQGLSTPAVILMSDNLCTKTDCELHPNPSCGNQIR